MSKTLETVAWRHPSRGFVMPDEHRKNNLTWPETKDHAERFTQRLCDQAAAEAIIAGLEADVAALQNDAERYRALRTGRPYTVRCTQAKTNYFIGDHHAAGYGEAFDAAADELCARLSTGGA